MQNGPSWSRQLLRAALALAACGWALAWVGQLLWQALPGLLAGFGLVVASVAVWQGWQWWRNRW